MCVCVCVCVWVCVCMRACARVRVYVYVFARVHICVHVCMYEHACLSLCMPTFVTNQRLLFGLDYKQWRLLRLQGDHASVRQCYIIWWRDEKL